MSEAVTSSVRKGTTKQRIHVGTRATHPLAKAALLLAFPSFALVLAYRLATTEPTQQTQALIAFLVAGAIIVGIPVVAVAWVYIGRGLPAFVSNTVASRLLPEANYVFHSRTGLKLYGDVSRQKYALGSRVYDFSAIADIDYATPYVRIRSKRGINAIEAIEVGGVQACEQYLRSFCDMTGIEY